MSSPRIILWDIETTHNIVATFRLFDQEPIPHTNVLQERYIVCAAWKELDKPKVHAYATVNDPLRFETNSHDDKSVVLHLREVLAEADVIVAHNGDEYDLKFLKGRMIAHGFSPLPPIPTIDTLKVARRQFLFNSNRLDYLGAYLKVGRKQKTSPELWLRVLQGDARAVREMVRYNKGDVLLLEKIFKKLQPYIPNHINRQLYGGSGCPRCGSLKVQARGTHKALTREYQRFQCQACAGWFRELKASGHKATTRVL